MLFIAEVMSEFAVEGAFNRGFGELLEQPVLAEQVIGLAVVFQQFIEQFRCNWHNRVFLSRLSS
jgi:hypothetical protein